MNEPLDRRQRAGDEAGGGETKIAVGKRSLAADRYPALGAAMAQRAGRGGAAPSIHDAATIAVEHKGSGGPVDGDVAARVGAHLGADFSATRVHEDPLAQQATAAMGARAFAYGGDVFLGPGERGGDLGLMAHELTHVAQQGAAGQRAPQRAVKVGDANSPAETEADQVAAAVTGGGGDAKPASLIVDDGPVQPGQMLRSQFFEQLRADVMAICTAELGPEFAGSGCPFVDQTFDRYRGLPIANAEALLKRTTPGAQAARTASDLIPLAVAHMRGGIQIWRDTGKAPPELAVIAPGAPVGTPPASEAAQALRAPDGGETLASLAADLGPGAPLDGGTASRMASALGADVSGARIHTGSIAARKAADAGAVAFAVGEHVVMGASAPAAGTIEGDALLAHELAHVAQQRDAAADPKARRAPIGGESAAAEDHADQHAEGALAELHGGGRIARMASRVGAAFKTGLQLQRCKNPEEKAHSKIVQLATRRAQGLPQFHNAVDGTSLAKLEALLTNLSAIDQATHAPLIVEVKQRYAHRRLALLELQRVAGVAQLNAAVDALSPAQLDGVLDNIAPADHGTYALLIPLIKQRDAHNQLAALEIQRVAGAAQLDAAIDALPPADVRDLLANVAGADVATYAVLLPLIRQRYAHNQLALLELQRNAGAAQLNAAVDALPQDQLRLVLDNITGADLGTYAALIPLIKQRDAHNHLALLEVQRNAGAAQLDAAIDAMAPAEVRTMLANTVGADLGTYALLLPLVKQRYAHNQLALLEVQRNAGAVQLAAAVDAIGHDELRLILDHIAPADLGTYAALIPLIKQRNAHNQLAALEIQRNAGAVQLAAAIDAIAPAEIFELLTNIAGADLGTYAVLIPLVRQRHAHNHLARLEIQRVAGAVQLAAAVDAIAPAELRLVLDNIAPADLGTYAVLIPLIKQRNTHNQLAALEIQRNAGAVQLAAAIDAIAPAEVFELLTNIAGADLGTYAVLIPLVRQRHAHNQLALLEIQRNAGAVQLNAAIDAMSQAELRLVLDNVAPADVITYAALLPLMKQRNAHNQLGLLEIQRNVGQVQLDAAIDAIAMPVVLELLTNIAPADVIPYAVLIPLVKQRYAHNQLALLEIQRLAGVPQLTAAVQAMTTPQTRIVLENILPADLLTYAVLIPMIKNERVIQHAEELEGSLTWPTPSGPDGTGQISRRRVDRFGNMADDDFAIWIRGGADPTDLSAMNCWEMVLYSAWRSGAVTKAFLVQVHTNAAAAYNANGGGVGAKTGAYYTVLGNAMGINTAAPWAGGAIPRGDVIFFGGLAHVAISTGVVTVPAAEHEIMSLWIFPAIPGHVNQRTTVEDMNVEITNLVGPKPVTHGPAPW